MPTLRQKRVAKKIIIASQLDNPPTGGEILKSTDYGIDAQRNPGRILESEGVKEALSDYGFSEENAKKVVGKVMNDDSVEPHARLKAADLTFKVHGTYAPEKSLALNVNVSSENKEAKELAGKYEEELKKTL